MTGMGCLGTGPINHPLKCPQASQDFGPLDEVRDRQDRQGTWAHLDSLAIACEVAIRTAALPCRPAAPQTCCWSIKDVTYYHSFLSVPGALAPGTVFFLRSPCQPVRILLDIPGIDSPKVGSRSREVA